MLAVMPGQGLIMYEHIICQQTLSFPPNAIPFRPAGEPYVHDINYTAFRDAVFVQGAGRIPYEATA